MEKKTTKITKEQITQIIKEEAEKIQKKQGIIEKINKLNEELKLLETFGMIGTFGFNVPGDKSKETITGFKEKQDISHLNMLQRDMDSADAKKEDGAEQLSEIEILKMENEKLKKQIEEISIKK